MAKRRSAKSAFLTSAAAVVMSFSMLLGTTFAWFTDSVTSANNIITSGNLDVELYHSDSKAKNEVVTSETKLFDDVDSTNWEPGAMAWEELTVKNAGTLDLKYNLTLSALNATVVDNVSFASMLKVAFVEDGFTYNRANVEALEASKWTTLQTFSLSDKLMNGESDVYGIIIWWQPSEMDNLFNMNNGKTTEVKVEVGVTLMATQLANEEDSFGPDYDEAAPWMGGVSIDWYVNADENATEYEISSPEELAGLAALVNGNAESPVTTYALRGTVVQENFKGKTIKLTNSLDLQNLAWAPIGTNPNPFLGNFDGQNHTVSNLNVENEGWAGLFGHVGKAAGSTIENVTVANATIKSNRMAGAVVGQIYGDVINCHVSKAEILVTPNAVGDSYDNGDKVGGIVGWLGDNGNNRVLSDCTAENVKLGAYRDVGGIVGYVASSTTVKNNAVKNIEITVDQTTNYYGDKDVNAGYVCGRINGTITETNNTNEESTISSTYSKNGLTLKADGEDNVRLYLVPETYEGATLNVPEGINTIGNYAFAYNSNVKTVVLPETVTDLGRGFDSSTVEKVVLNKGLEVISSRAFRNTTALKEVVISTTVTEIAADAFQKTGLKSITIPATVEKMGATAFGASLIETVIFEGNTSIENKAFRSCTQLKKVYFKGEDITFENTTGQANCWFCNSESNNPGVSSIIFYVENETVANKVVAAMGAEKYAATKSGDKYIVAPPTVTNPTNTADKLIENLENGNDVTLVEDIAIPSASASSNGYGATGINVLNGQTIDGNGNALSINKWGTWDSAINTTGGLIKNIKITGGMRGIFVNHNSTNNKKVILENVIIDGTIYTISCDQGTNQGLEATNSTFNGWTSYAATIGNVKFNNCNFGEGQGYAFCRPYAPTEFVGCNFEAGFELDAVAAVTFKNCTIGGVALTAENLATLVVGNFANASVIA